MAADNVMTPLGRNIILEVEDVLREQEKHLRRRTLHRRHSSWHSIFFLSDDIHEHRHIDMKVGLKQSCDAEYIRALRESASFTATAQEKHRKRTRARGRSERLLRARMA